MVIDLTEECIPLIAIENGEGGIMGRIIDLSFIIFFYIKSKSERTTCLYLFEKTLKKRVIALVPIMF